MNKLVLLIFCILHVSSTYSQNQSPNTESEYIAYYRIEAPTEWQELNEHQEILPDLIFMTSRGFTVYSDITYATIGGVEYVLVVYPDFNGGKDKNRLKIPLMTAPAKPIYEDLDGQNGKWLCIKKSIYQSLTITPLKGIRKNIRITGGQLTVPFKLRPKHASNPFQMTTDVTIGAYIGIRLPLSMARPHYVTLPITAGLTFININDNTTTTASPGTTEAKIVPGITWSTGIILQFDKINVGFVFGKDYASQVVDEWIYHKKTWFSFAIGFSFLK